MNDRNNKPKIFILATLAEIGGVQVFVYNLAKELSNRGFNVTVGFGEGEFLEEKCIGAGIRTHRFFNLKRSLGVLTNLRFFLECRRYLKRNGFDVFHINSSNTLMGALSAFCLFGKRPKVVFTYGGLSFLDKNHEMSDLKRTLVVYLFRFFMLFVDVEVFVSKANIKMAKMMGLGKKGVVIYNGLSIAGLDFLEESKAREELEKISGMKLKGKKVVGSIGRLAYQKNYEFLIRNWKKVKEEVPKAVCIVVGGGPDYDKLEEMMEETGVKDQDFVLAGAYKDAGRFMKGFDLFVLTSRYEGLSITTLEAIFAGVPILITDTGGNPEVVGGYEPFLFELNNDEEFIEKATSILKDEDALRKARKVSRKECYNFGISTMVSEYERVYRGE